MRVSQARLSEKTMFRWFYKMPTWSSTLFYVASQCFIIYLLPKSILKEISPGISLEGMMLKLKLQYFGHVMRRADSLEKTDAGRDWGQEEKGTTKNEMAGWHHQLDGREFRWTLGVGNGQRGLVCCDSLGRKESDMTEQLNWTELIVLWGQVCRYSDTFCHNCIIFCITFFFFQFYLMTLW